MSKTSKTNTPGKPENLYSIEDELTVEGVPDRTAQYLGDLYRQHQYAVERLNDAAISIKDRMDRVQRNLATGYSINSLGELQSQGPEFDRLCALHQSTAEAMSKAIFWTVDGDELRLTVKAILFGGAS